MVVTLIGADLAYLDRFSSNLATVGLFLFVSGGWIISLSLHEFGHALVAFVGGDESVDRRGYLSLNPLKYTNIVLSILFPLVILLLGGIGLPGGAVYVNPQAIRSRGMRSLMSAAGPIASALCGSCSSSLFWRCSLQCRRLMVKRRRNRQNQGR